MYKVGLRTVNWRVGVTKKSETVINLIQISFRAKIYMSKKPLKSRCTNICHIIIFIFEHFSDLLYELLKIFFCTAPQPLNIKGKIIVGGGVRGWK